MQKEGKQSSPGIIEIAEALQMSEARAPQAVVSAYHWCSSTFPSLLEGCMLLVQNECSSSHSV
jgi:hypothetical protein